MKKILCPIDFSTASISGLQYAFNVAKQFHSELVIFHAIQFSAQERGQNMLLPEDLENLMENASDQLEREFKNLEPANREAKIPISYISRFGFAEDEILNLTNELKVDLVIMGTEGADGLNKLLGTLSAKIIAKAPCPVLVVPQDTKFEKIDQIVYATDIQGMDDMVINYIINFAKVFNAHVALLNIQNPQDENLGDVFTYSSRIHNLSNYNNMSFHVIGHEDLLDGINSFAEGNNVDLIVMATEKRNFLQTIFSKSKTKAIAHETRIPLLAMHKEEFYQTPI